MRCFDGLSHSLSHSVERYVASGTALLGHEEAKAQVTGLAAGWA
jgi:hypothetical protein